MIKYLIVFLCSFIMAGLISPLIIYLSKKFKAKQTILHYVKEHELKQGTPTMGGFIFIIATTVIALLCLNSSAYFSIVTIFTMLSYGVLGFLDDYIKIKYKQNLGLRAYQKIIGQVGIALVVSIFVYKIFGGEIFIPFTHSSINLGYFIVPFNTFVFLAVVNSVNLLDGLDGLASGVSFIIVLAFASLMIIQKSTMVGQALSEQRNLIMICFCLCGSLIAYFGFNCFPAKIFMGDTGSLALGGFICSIAVFSGLTLYIPIIGLCLVITSLSDIIQVAYFKKTKKRIFRMAPLHHHFQMSGVHENRIVTIYIITTMLISILTVALILL